MLSWSVKTAFLFLISVCASLCFCGTLCAHPWVHKKGVVHLVNSSLLVRDDTGNLVGPGPTNMLGIRQTIMAEYGLTDALTIGAKTELLLYGRTSNIVMEDTAFGSTGISLYFRYKLFEYKGFLFSFEPQVKTPSFYQNNPIGAHVFDPNSATAVEFRAVVGYSWYNNVVDVPWLVHAEGFHVYFSASYRHRTNVLQDMLTIEGSVGFNPSNNFAFIAQIRKVWQLYLDADGHVFDFDSYHLFAVTAYFVTHISESTSVALGITFDIVKEKVDYSAPYAHNGPGISLGFWNKF